MKIEDCTGTWWSSNSCPSRSISLLAFQKQSMRYLQLFFFFKLKKNIKQYSGNNIESKPSWFIGNVYFKVTSVRKGKPIMTQVTMTWNERVNTFRELRLVKWGTKTLGCSHFTSCSFFHVPFHLLQNSSRKTVSERWSIKRMKKKKHGNDIHLWLKWSLPNLFDNYRTKPKLN
jgi:hypothetical protein